MVSYLRSQGGDVYFRVLGSKAKKHGEVFSKPAVDRTMCRMCGPMWAVGYGHFREIVCRSLRARGKEFPSLGDHGLVIALHSNGNFFTPEHLI